MFDLRSTAFKEGEPIPRLHTCDGDDRSPALTWDGDPDGTQSYVLICEDPDAPGETFTHWVMWNIPRYEFALMQGIATRKKLPGDIRQGKNDFGNIGYGGPCPPVGQTHSYVFRLIALDTVLDIKPGADKDTLLRAIDDHILGEATLTGTYQRTE